MDVGAWLRALGLGQYETTFRDSEIDAEVLPDLTDGDLGQLGVPLGHRKRLLKAIAALGTGETAAKPASPAPASSPAGVAERRPITVMFCDLVGSTGLAAKLDAEDWRDLVGAYLDEASAAVTGLGGHVLKKLGDGLMALFGYPHAQENDAERAVRAALAIQRALVEINARNASKGASELSARIGLDSGQVVVDATGEVFGDAPNIAARVQSAAGPGSILITATVQRQTAGLFVAEDRGQHALKGVSAPMTLYRIVRASGGGRRGGARALTPLVGREEELGLLTRRWERAHKGEGQLALIVGEPGIGKSRLIEEFRGKLADTPHTWVEWSSSQLLQNTPLHPIAEWGRHRFGADLPAEQRFADLEHTLRLIGLDPTECAPLLAPLVGVLLPEDRAAKLAPEELRRRQLSAMTAWILAAARTQAVVLAFEDLHWADPTSLDLIRALAERGAQAPLLIIATARPEFRPPWSVRSHHSAISLSPLDRMQIGKMVRELSAHHALPRDIVEGVSERTGGVPLFVEEVTRLLLERGEQGGAQAIPPTLQQSLAARLDQLGSARETAQIGSVLGRGFSYALLQSVAGLDEDALQSALERLAEADILFVEGDGAQATYRFKHALIQDAAYDSLLKSRRQAMHRRAAEILCESASPEPEAIAHHFTQAGLDDLAIEWWGKAGDQALRRSAFQEAIAHLGKAIKMADKAAGVSSRGQKLHVAYGNALIAARGYGAPETTQAFARARESAVGDKDEPGRLAADYGLWVGSFTRGELPAMRAHADTFLGDVEAGPDSPEAGVAHRAAGLTHWFAGEYREAREHLERALALFQPGRDDDLAFRFGHDAGAGAMLYLALTLWPLGEVERAVSLICDAEARIAGLAHTATRAHAKWHVAMFWLMRGDLSRAAPNAAELATLTRESELSLWRARGGFLDGLSMAENGRHSGALEAMRRGVESLREQNVLVIDGLIKIALAEAEARAGDVDRALAILDEALATCERIGHRAFDAELHRVRGEMLLRHEPTNPAPAEAAFGRAIEIAGGQGTRSFSLRASLSIAKLYRSTGRPGDAHSVLAPALEGFAPTLEMPEIAEAQALLTALAATDEVKAQAAHRQRLTQLHVSYGNALIAARGYAAPETTEAFARARESAAGDKDAPGRLSADYGLWVGAVTRGKLPEMRGHAAAFLSDLEARPDSPEAGVAHRAAGMTHWFAGEYKEARDHLERALALFLPVRDDDLALRFAHDAGVAAMLHLAFTLWPLGDVERAVSLVADAEVRIAGLSYKSAYAMGKMHAGMFGLVRSVVAQAASNATELARVAHDHDLNFWRPYGLYLEGWVKSMNGAPADGLEDIDRGLDLLREQNTVLFVPLLKLAAGQAEARAGDLDRALATLDEGLATSERTGHRAFDAELNRVRGDILLMRESADPAPADEAYRTAIAIAQQQGARSFELRAAVALAKLYQSTARPADAHAVLAPALDGFAPTPEMPEIAEAQSLLAALAATDEVKAEAARRGRLTQLHVSYGNALIAARGYSAPETTEAFAKAREAASGDKDTPGRLAADYGLWVGSFMRGDLPSMRAHATAFLSDLEARPDSPEASVARRISGVTCWCAGEYAQARDYFEKALALFQPGRDDDMAFRFGQDPGVVAMTFLAIASWPLGEVDRAISLIDRMQTRMAERTHVGTLALGRMQAAMFELMRGDHARGAPHAFELARLAREHALPMWRAFGVFLQGWATSTSGAIGAGLDDMRRAVDELRAQNVLLFDGLVKIALAEAEARADDPGRAVAILDEALTTADRLGYRTFEAELHRARGDILLQRDPTNSAPAEEAFLTALAVAKQQGTRSFELRAALSLAKLYQSTGRPAAAHAVLAPALDGFAPTKEMPEIAESQALLAALAETEEVKASIAQRKRRLDLQTAYGQALLWSKGFAAEETKAAFDRARELADRGADTAPLFSVRYEQFTRGFIGGDMKSAKGIAEDFLRDAEGGGYAMEVVVGRRILGSVCLFQGDLVPARTDLERVLADYAPDRDAEARLRFGMDTRIVGMAYLALASWHLGEVERCRLLIEEAVRLAIELGHAATLAFAYNYQTIIEARRGDSAAALDAAERLAHLTRERDLDYFLAASQSWSTWARARSLGSRANPAELAEDLSDQKRRDSWIVLPFYFGLLGEIEAATGNLDGAFASIGAGLAIAEKTGERYTDSFLHRLRGDILLKRNPNDPAPAEEAHWTAIAIAKQQESRSYELIAALALAKLYQSTGRPAEAHAVLAPALEGFAPTPEMPEIEEALEMIAAIDAGPHL
jgi:class 3 adenylate cyclase/predicted ATPase